MVYILCEDFLTVTVFFATRGPHLSLNVVSGTVGTHDGIPDAGAEA